MDSFCSSIKYVPILSGSGDLRRLCGARPRAIVTVLLLAESQSPGIGTGSVGCLTLTLYFLVALNNLAAK
jgi:hypothetical protein